MTPISVRMFAPAGDGQRMRVVGRSESPLLGVPNTGSFFGREDDIAKLVEKLSDHRFVSIIGTGGIGKSSIATATARWLSRHRRFRDGILWASLSDSQSIDVLLSAIPSLFQQDPVDSVAKLTQLMRDKDVLLILNNLESILHAEVRATTRASLNQLLRDTNRLRVAATTRELVGGLEPGETPAELGSLDDESALNLLADRAPDSKTMRAEVRVDWPSRTLIYSGSLRGLLDEFHGYPLAIATAAPHLRHFGVRELLDRIKAEGIAVYDDPNIHDPVERTRMASLAVSLRLSVRRLSDDGAVEALSLFGVLSMFPAGLTKALLERLELPGWERNARRLRDHSMVEYHQEDNRYYLLAPIRHFAKDYLDADTRRTVAERVTPILAAIADELHANWPKRGVGTTARLLTRDEANFIAAIDLGRDLPAPSPESATPSLDIAGFLIDLYQSIDRLRSAGIVYENPVRRLLAERFCRTCLGPL